VELKDKRVLVVGLGKSGVASAQFLQARGAKVTVSDAKSPEQLAGEIPGLLNRGIAVETGGHGERTFRGQDLIVVSPGVPADSDPLVQARVQGVPIIGEIELAAQFLQGRIVAITGSNGKTTTTTLTGEILAASGLPVVVGGNIGTPAISLVDQTTPKSFVVLEVSSFQLETIQTFRPFISAILNVTPDHLDRHRTLEAYVKAKARIFENQKESDFCVLNADDAAANALTSRAKCPVLHFSRRREVTAGAFVRNGKILFRDNQSEREILPIEVLSVAEITLQGAHNLENVLAAVCIASLAGCPAEKIGQAVRAFKAVEHRLEFVAEIGGVRYFNDSKATNVDATIKALESFPANIHLILGGKDKGSDYSVLNGLLRERVKQVYTIGTAAEKIARQIREAARIVPAGTLENAVHRASATAQPGDIVLLAPACASFDQFQSYEHRGRLFKEAVQALAEGPRQEGPSQASRT
jgi:UDP-N-acetylmuramoylalanine--D-glutamate ligase